MQIPKICRVTIGADRDPGYIPNFAIRLARGNRKLEGAIFGTDLHTGFFERVGEIG